MYRVELKAIASYLREKLVIAMLVPNVPCGVESRPC